MTPPAYKTDVSWRLAANCSDITNVRVRDIRQTAANQQRTHRQTTRAVNQLGAHPAVDSGIQKSYAFQKLRYWKEACRQYGMHTLANEVCMFSNPQCCTVSNYCCGGMLAKMLHVCCCPCYKLKSSRPFNIQYLSTRRIILQKDLLRVCMQAKAICRAYAGGREGLYQGGKLATVLAWEQENSNRWRDASVQNAPFTASIEGFGITRANITAFMNGKLHPKLGTDFTNQSD